MRVFFFIKMSILESNYATQCITNTNTTTQKSSSAHSMNASLTQTLPVTSSFFHNALEEN